MSNAVRRLLEPMKRGYRAVFGADPGEPKKKARKIGSAPNEAAADSEADLESEVGERQSNDDQGKKESSKGARHASDKASERNARSDIQSPFPEGAAEAPATYIFAGEDEDDYTRGTARMIVSHDGDKQCTALLLTSQFSQALQAFVKAQHRLLQEQDRAEQEDEIFAAYRTYAEEAICESYDKYDEFRKQAGQEAEVKKYQKRARFLKRKLKRVEEVEQQSKGRLQEIEHDERSAKFGLAVLLEEIFHDCRLLPVQERQDDLHPGFREEFATPDISDVSESIPLNTRDAVVDDDDSSHTRGRTETSSTRGRAEAAEKLCKAELGLEQAEREFDNRAKQRHREADSFHRRVATSNPPSRTVKSFDLRQLQRGRDLTRRLVDAEEAVAAAKAHALAIGAKLDDDDRSSGFADHSQDGQGSAIVENPHHYINRPSIMEWLRQVPDNAHPGWRLSDGKQHERVNVEICDSLSAIVQGSYRKRIDKWRDMREQVRAPKRAVLRKSSRRKKY